MCPHLPDTVAVSLDTLTSLTSLFGLTSVCVARLLFRVVVITHTDTYLAHHAAGSLFYFMETTVAGARTYFGLSFLSVLFINFGSFPQLPITLEGKKVTATLPGAHRGPAARWRELLLAPAAEGCMALGIGEESASGLCSPAVI